MAPADDSLLFQYGTGKRGTGLREDGHRELKQPRGVSVDSDGSLLVADFGSHCVLRFEQNDVAGQVVAGEEGKNLPTADPLKDIDRPTGPAQGEGFLMKRPIDVCAHDERGVLVLDSEVCRIQHYASAQDKATTVVPPPHLPPQRSVSNPESIKYPRSMLLMPSGDLVVCDTWSHRVLRYPANGGSVEVLAGKSNSGGTAPEQMSFPSGMAFDSDGNLYVTDTNNHRVQCFPPGKTSGTTVAGSADGEPGPGLDRLNMPTGICIDPRDGSLLIADRMNARVLRFPAGGAKQGEVILSSASLERPWGICQDADGAIYVSDERKAVVLKMDSPAPLSSAQGGKPAPAPAPKPKATKPFAPAPRVPETPTPPAAPAPLLESEVAEAMEPQAKQCEEEKIAIAGDHNELD